MLKKMSIKKIITSSIVLMIVFLLYIIPTPSKKETKIPSAIEYVNVDVKTHSIYLLDNNNYISKTSIRINSLKPEELAQQLIQMMIQEGKYSDQIPSGFRPIINSNTKINSISLSKDTLKVDLSKDFLSTTKELEEKTLEALIYTLTSIEQVNYIVLYIDGKILTKLPQNNINLPATLNREIGINKKYDLKNTKNITSTTIYYIHEYNDDFYYTPVTTIHNDEREKIEIIIDELSNSITQKPLMSFVNSKTNLIDYKVKDKKMEVCFNENIFNDFDKKDILEEVLYTISLSIYDNYDVEEVIFQVNNQEIAKTTVKSLE